MTLYFVRWPMEIEADIRDEHPICSNCEDDWGSLDGPKAATRRSRWEIKGLG
jgi:hypothetical protein